MKQLHLISNILLIAAGLNWGLIAAFHVNLIDLIAGGTIFDTAIYLCFGFAALYKVVYLIPFTVAKKASEGN